jgi:hypothetical protein
MLMLKGIKQSVFIFLCFVALGSSIGIAGENIPVIVIPNNEAACPIQEDKIIEIVKNCLPINENSYVQAKVQVSCGDSATPENLVVELLYRAPYLSETVGRDIYLNETVVIAMGENYTVMNENVPVIIMPSEGTHCFNEEKIVEIVKKQLLFPSQNPYAEAKVAVFYNDANEPDYLFVYLMRKDVYSFETVKVVLGNNYNVVSVEKETEQR